MAEFSVNPSRFDPQGIERSPGGLHLVRPPRACRSFTLVDLLDQLASQLLARGLYRGPSTSGAAKGARR